MGPNEDGMALLALDIGVQCRCHGGFRRFALALDQAPLQSYLGNVTCITMLFFLTLLVVAGNDWQ